MADAATNFPAQQDPTPSTPARQSPQELLDKLNQPASSSKERLPPVDSASQKISSKQVAKQLADIIKGISAPFACGGFVNTNKIGISIQLLSGASSDVDVASTVTVAPPSKPERPATASWNWNWRTEVENAQVEKLRILIDRMPQAAFGHGKETKVDVTVRDALQLPASEFEADVPQAVVDEILEKVRAGLNLDTEIVAERYSLNVYRKNGHFLKHKDTPRGDDMLGTLVLCLPSYYTGGAMKVTQGMQEHTFFDGGSNSGYCYGGSQELPSPGGIKWCAFFSDVDHEIVKVCGGVRITLAYLLRRKDSQCAAANIPHSLSRPEQYARLVQSLSKAMRGEGFMTKGGTLGFPCFHLYTNGEVFPGGSTASAPLSELGLKKLKGRDAVIARAAVACGLKISLVPFLGHDYSYDDCGFFRLKKFPTSKRVPRRMSDDSIERHFNAEHVESFDQLGVRWVFDMNKAGRANAGDTEWNAEGYFGNEASGISFYVHAALFVNVPSFEARQKLLAVASHPKLEDLGDVAGSSPEREQSAESDDEADEADEGGGVSDEFGGSSDEFGFGGSSDEFGGSDDDFDNGFAALDPRMLALLMRGVLQRPRAKSKGKAKSKAKGKAGGKAKAKACGKSKAKANAKGNAKAVAKSQAKAKADATTQSKRQKTSEGT